MNCDKTQKLCLEMFLDVIPKNIDINGPGELTCYRTLNNSFENSRINGERHSPMLDDKYSFLTDSLIKASEKCFDTEINEPSTKRVRKTSTNIAEKLIDTEMVDESPNIIEGQITDADIIRGKSSNICMAVDSDTVVDKPSDSDMIVDKPSDSDMVLDKPSDSDMVLDNSSDFDVVMNEPSNANFVHQTKDFNDIECDSNLKDESSAVLSASSIKHKPCEKGLNFSGEIKVECLESLESLQDRCEKEGLNFNDYVTEKEFEVDMIYNSEFFNGETHYFIKWKNYSSEANTWEPRRHLKGCQEIIDYYNAMKSLIPRYGFKNLLFFFVKDLITRKPCDILTLTKAYKICFSVSEKQIKSLQLTVSEMKQHMKEIFNFPDKKIHRRKEKLFEIMKYGESRKSVLINLKEWEEKINSENQTAYIEVENNVDLETAPDKFEFIHDYVSTIARIPEEPVAFCNCGNCYENRDSCCPHDSEGHFAYSRYQRLTLLPGYPIYECNKLCKCSSDCINRYVQHGQKVKVAIFRTSNGCGWGLKTLETIEKGQFVLEYLGEIITSDEAEARGKIYDYIGRSYLFDLDYGVDDCCYTIDAGHAGNVAHFINHSCNPNLHVFAVWINQQDPNLPRLAFFARRKIKRGEELTFDYKMVQKDRFGPQNPVPKNDRILCHCNSANCRKFLF